VKEWMKMGLWSMLLWACVEPARSPLGTPAPLPPQVFTQECNGLRVQMTLEQTRASALVSEVLITDSSGHLLADIARVILAFTSGGQNLSTTTVVARPTEAGLHVPTGKVTMPPGSWTVEVIVRRTTGLAVTCVFSLNLS
jgi:hypothetical protein